MIEFKDYILLHFEHPDLGDVPHLLKSYELESGKVNLKSYNLLKQYSTHSFYAFLGEHSVKSATGYSFYTFMSGIDGLTREDLPNVLEKYPNLKRY